MNRDTLKTEDMPDDETIKNLDIKRGQEKKDSSEKKQMDKPQALLINDKKNRISIEKKTNK